MLNSPTNAVLLSSDSILEVTDRGIGFHDAEGTVRFASFAECQANVAMVMPRATSDGVPLVGFRDGSAPQPWIEIATRPPTRFLFERGASVGTVGGGKFVARQHVPAYLALLAAVGEHGFAFGDLR